MKRIIAMLAVCGAAAAANASVTTYGTLAGYLANSTGPNTLENFDSAPWVTGNNANPTTNFGVSWSTPETLFGTTVGFVSGPRAISPLDGSVTDEFNVTLPAGIGSVGLWASTFGQAHNVEIRAFAPGGALLGTAVIGPSAGNAFNFGGIVSTVTPIASLTIISDVGGGNDDFMIDDFYFAAIPSPSALGVLGVAGLAGLRRRR
jgi:hypothetical protein